MPAATARPEVPDHVLRIRMVAQVVQVWLVQPAEMVAREAMALMELPPRVKPSASAASLRPASASSLTEVMVVMALMVH